MKRVGDDPATSIVQWRARAVAIALLTTTACVTTTVDKAARRNELAEVIREMWEVGARFDRLGVRIEFIYLADRRGLKLLCWAVTQASSSRELKTSPRELAASVERYIDWNWVDEKPTLLKVILRREKEGWSTSVEAKKVDAAATFSMVRPRGGTVNIASANDVGRAITEALSHNAASGEATINIVDSRVGSWALPFVDMSNESVPKPPESFDREIGDSIASLQRWRDHGQLILRMRALRDGEQKARWRVLGARDVTAIKEIGAPAEMCGGVFSAADNGKRP
jgi:hypothetical protein